MIEITATDINSNWFTTSFTLTLLNNVPTVTGSPSDVTVYDNITSSIDLVFSDYFSDDDTPLQTLTYSVSNVPSFATDSSNSTNLLLDVTALDANINQNYTVNLFADDGFDTSSTTLIIEVLENKQPTPTVTEYNITLLEGDSGTETIPMYDNYSETDSVTYT